MSDHVLLGFAPSAQQPAWPGGDRVPTPTPQRGGRRSARTGAGGATPATPWHIALCSALRTAWRRHRSRTYLLELSAHLRKDIGISSAEAEREGNKPFWLA